MEMGKVIVVKVSVVMEMGMMVVMESMMGMVVMTSSLRHLHLYQDWDMDLAFRRLWVRLLWSKMARLWSKMVCLVNKTVLLNMRIR
jgi:hypothetical protein